MASSSREDPVTLSAANKMPKRGELRPFAKQL